MRISKKKYQVSKKSPEKQWKKSQGTKLARSISRNYS